MEVTGSRGGLKATEDGNYNASPTVSAQFSTEYTTVDPGDLSAVLQPQSYPYTGNPVSVEVTGSRGAVPACMVKLTVTG